MHRSSRYRSRSAPVQTSLALKGLLLIFLLCVAIRTVSVLGADTASKDYVTGLVSDQSVVEAMLDFEIGPAAETDAGVNLMSLILNPTLYTDATQDASQNSQASPTLPDSPSPAGATGVTPSAGTLSNVTDAWLYYNWNTAGSPDTSPNIITKPTQPASADSIEVFNKTNYTVDTAALLKEPLKLTLTENKPAVLIIHTHGSEAYSPDGKDQYVESDPFRTQNKAQSVIRVGDELTAAFEKQGISVIHDPGVYDYPSYQHSYNNSGAAIQSYLKKYPSIKIVIDLHRDAIEDDDGNVYRTIAQVGDVTCSQLYFVIGTNSSGLKHPNWRENFKLALYMQQEMNRLYPSLAKPIELSQLRYNQQMTPGSMIVEIGCTGNTLQESLTAARYFADAASRVLLGLYK